MIFRARRRNDRPRKMNRLPSNIRIHDPSRHAKARVFFELDRDENTFLRHASYSCLRAAGTPDGVEGIRCAAVAVFVQKGHDVGCHGSGVMVGDL